QQTHIGHVVARPGVPDLLDGARRVIGARQRESKPQPVRVVRHGPGHGYPDNVRPACVFYQPGDRPQVRAVAGRDAVSEAVSNIWPYETVERVLIRLRTGVQHKVTALTPGGALHREPDRPYAGACQCVLAFGADARIVLKLLVVIDISQAVGAGGAHGE